MNSYLKIIAAVALVVLATSRTCCETAMGSASARLKMVGGALWFAALSQRFHFDLGVRAMRWIPLVLMTTITSICFAEPPDIPGCDPESAVVCFVDRAQARLRSCLLAPIPPDAAGIDKPQPRPALDEKQRNACVADAHREIDPLYRQALVRVRYMRGTTSAVKDYYEDWEKVLNRRGAPLAADSTTASDSWRPDFERLNLKAERLRQER